MTCYQFEGLLLKDGWRDRVYVTTDTDGRIVGIADRTDTDDVEIVSGYAIPGFQNGHSHAFQYAMVGSAEHLLRESDDFWSWRESMYALASTIGPEEMEAVASMLYGEMLRVGFTAVAEFHYLHHDPDGTPYARPETMAECLIAAARKTGIQITLIPIFYQTSDFGEPAKPEQRRFLSNSMESYFRLLSATEKAAQAYSRCRLGMGIHSLRAAKPEDVPLLFENAPKNAPLHIHIAEQQKEVRRCLQHLNSRPVSWLLDNVAVDKRYNLVHATHLDPSEVERLSRSGATVVICPSTEGNLGDGFFPLQPFQRGGGNWCIGTDSHVGLSPMEELRWLDYGQRLRLEQRNILCETAGQDSGERAFRQAFFGGRKAMGCWDTEDYFEVGRHLDAVVLDRDHPLLGSCHNNRRLSTLIYACDGSALLGTICAGKWVVYNQKHIHGEQIAKTFADSMKRLGDR